VKRLAFVADDEIFLIDTFFRKTTRESYEQKALSNPLIISIDDYIGLPLGSLYENGLFYEKNDVDKVNPYQKFPVQPERDFWKGFALILDGVVFSTAYFNKLSPDHQILIAGFSSNPKIYDVTDIEGIEIGWIWNGETFISPGQDQS
jgi:hypothetical protein